jgi:predicted acyltransferase
MQADIVTTQEPAIVQSAPVRRLLSLDTLRGFDMFWIMGGDAIFHTLAKVTGWEWAVLMANQFTHVEWNGFRPYDCIFPLFLFLAGVSTPFSIGSRLHKGDNHAQLARKIIGRGFLLVLFGLILNNGLFLKSFDEMRFPSVLARIGLAGMCAQLLFLYVRDEQVRYGIFAGILLGYWAMMMLIPVPGFGAGNLTMEGSLVGYVDRIVMPGHLYKVVHDPEGLLSTLPAICTGLLGVFAGTLLQRNDSSDSRKLQRLILGGIACLALGWAWNLVFPVNKNLWTSSFVLVAGGWSLLMLGLFYWVIDIKNIRGWTFFFMVIGMNSILIYMARKFIDFGFTAKSLFGGLLGFFSEPVQLVGAVLALLAVKWAFLYFLYCKKVFLRV